MLLIAILTSVFYLSVLKTSSIGGVTPGRILGAPTQPASLQSAGWVGAPKIRPGRDSSYTTSELPAHNTAQAARRPGIYRCSEF